MSVFTCGRGSIDALYCEICQYAIWLGEKGCGTLHWKRLLKVGDRIKSAGMQVPDGTMGTIDFVEVGRYGVTWDEEQLMDIGKIEDHLSRGVAALERAKVCILRAMEICRPGMMTPERYGEFGTGANELAFAVNRIRMADYDISEAFQAFERLVNAEPVILKREER